MSKKGVENFKRRTWDQKEYERLALEREDRERSGALSSTAGASSDEFAVETEFGKFQYANAGAAGPTGSSKAYLDVEKARGNLDLDSKIGKVEKFAGGVQQAGFHCSVCDRTFQDTSALLDHLNSREHQARLGFSSYVAPSSKEQVKSRLATHTVRAASSLASKTVTKAQPETLEARVKAAEEALVAKKAEKELKKKQKMSSETKDGNEAAIEENPGLLAELGFASFGN